MDAESGGYESGETLPGSPAAAAAALGSAAQPESFRPPAAPPTELSSLEALLAAELGATASQAAAVAERLRALPPLDGLPNGPPNGSPNSSPQARGGTASTGTGTGAGEALGETDAGVLLGARAALGLLRGAGFTGPELSRMLLVCPQLARGAQTAGGAADMADFLAASFGLRRYDVRRLARSEPRLFATNTSTVAATVSALAGVGLRGKALVLALFRWPALLLAPPAAIASVAAFLARPEVCSCYMRPEVLRPLAQAAALAGK